MWRSLPAPRSGARPELRAVLRAGRLGLAFALCFALALPRPALADNASANPLDAVDAYVQKQMAQEGFPGVAVAIVQHGQVIYLKGFGVTSLADPQPVTPQTIFDLASSSKSFTAEGVLILTRRGLLSLDAPLVQYVPEFTLADQAAAQRITVRELLSHTSGIPGSYTEPAAYYDGPDAYEQMLATLAGLRLDREPGTTFEYSNTNYCLLGLLIQRVSGQSFEDFMAENLFQPLGLGHTTLKPEVAAALGKADGHQPVFGTLIARNIPAIESAKAAGWVMSSAEDMARWLILQLDGGLYQGRQLLPAADVALAQIPVVYYENDGNEVGYGMGWFSGQSEDGEALVWHGGDTPNFMSDMLLVPGRDFGVVVLANAQSTSVGHIIAPGIADMLEGIQLQHTAVPWWSYWKTVDDLATWGLGLSCGMVLGLGGFSWYLGRAFRRHRYTIRWPWRHSGRPPYMTVLYVAPITMVALLASLGYLLVKLFWGWNMYRVLIAFRLASPPGVWITGVTLLSLLALWGLALAFFALFTRRRRAGERPA